MIVCSCRSVNDATVRAAIASGADSLEEIEMRCNAGGRCGGCWPELERLLAKQAEEATLRASHAAA